MPTEPPPPSKPAKLANKRPFLGGHRLNREARIGDERHRSQSLVRLDLLKRDRTWQGTHGANVDHAELAARIIRIGSVSFADFDDADDRLTFVGVVEKSLLADFHRLHVELGGMIANAAPVGARGAQTRQFVEGPRRGLTLEQPVRHGRFTPYDWPTPRCQGFTPMDVRRSKPSGAPAIFARPPRPFR